MKLPKPPSLIELQEHIPSIGKVPEEAHRPFWSVMIPTYNTGDYLRRTLQSVLAQDEGPDQMQIEVVDGCSTNDDPESLVRELGGNRVAFYRLASNKGLSHTFNTCIQRARGHWVHILHGDDVVLPGFYAAYRAQIESTPQVVMVFGKVVTIDGADRWLFLSPAGPLPEETIVEDFVQRQAVEQQVPVPTVVVKRTAYEQAGGFCSWFKHVVDMDMWFRVGLVGPVARVPVAYALYRKHVASDTNLHTASAGNVREIFISNLVNLERIRAAGLTANIDQRWRKRLAAYGEEWAWRLDGAGHVRGRFNQARFAWALDPTPRRFMFMAKSWLKAMLKRRKPAPGPASGDTWRFDDHAGIGAAKAPNDNVLKGTDR
jgi:GT2 family glycosyltransferase